MIARNSLRQQKLEYFQYFLALCLQIAAFGFFPTDKPLKLEGRTNTGKLIIIEPMKKRIKIKNHVEFPNIPRSYINNSYTLYYKPLPQNFLIEDYDLNDKQYECEIPFFHSNVSYQFIEFKDIIYETGGGYIYGDTDYIFDKYIHKKSLIVSWKLDKAIAITTSWGAGYGDHMLGQLIRLIILPKEYFDTSVLISSVRNFKHYLRDVLDMLEVNPQILFLGECDAVFAKTLYTVVPHYTNKNFPLTLLHCVYGPLASEFGTRIRKHFKCDDIIPTEYTVYNRPRGKIIGRKANMRRFTNFNEIVERLRAEFPEKNITSFAGNFRSFGDTVIRHAKIKWILAYVGSNCMNYFFLKEKCTACLAMAKGHYDYPAIQACLSRNLRIVTFSTNSAHAGKPAYIDPGRIVIYAKKSFILEETTE